jgi:cell wall-associated NlpC family hydrolase
MKRKRLIAVGLIAFVMTTGTGIAFASVIESTDATGKENLVTQVKQEIIISGPVKTETLSPRVIFKPEDPEVGSIEWMAKEKEEKERLRLEAIEKEAELQAEVDRLKAELEAEVNRQAIIKENTEKLNNTIKLVKAQVGITPWVFQGSNRRSWDCSGLVKWTYAQIGVDLYHSASVQRNSGTIVTEPKLGDLVSFNYKGWRNAYHIGIYLGPDQMIHAGGKPGDRTEIISISGWAKDNNGSDVVYTRMIETNN